MLHCEDLAPIVCKRPAFVSRAKKVYIFENMLIVFKYKHLTLLQSKIFILNIIYLLGGGGIYSVAQPHPGH